MLEASWLAKIRADHFYVSGGDLKVLVSIVV